MNPPTPTACPLCGEFPHPGIPCYADMKVSPKDQGFGAATLGHGFASNPYWPDCGKQKDETPEQERINARLWVDGYVEALIKQRIPHDPDKLRSEGLNWKTNFNVRELLQAQDS